MAGCGDARSTIDDIGRFVGREIVRRHDAKSVRDDPFLEAAFRGNLEMVQQMLDADPQSAREHLESRDPTGMTALHKATWGGHPEIVGLLLERGAEVDARDGSGDTALTLAARGGRADLMDLLLARGADASAHDDQGRGLLHKAAQYGHVEVMEVLIARGLWRRVVRPGSPSSTNSPPGAARSPAPTLRT